MASKMTPQEAVELIQTILDHPALKQMADLDTWGRDQGIDSDLRSKIVTEVSSFLVGAPSVEIGKEYVQRLATIVAAMGPSLIAAMRTEVTSK